MLNWHYILVMRIPPCGWACAMAKGVKGMLSDNIDSVSLYRNQTGKEQKECAKILQQCARM